MRIPVLLLSFLLGAPVFAQDMGVTGQLEVSSSTTAKEKLDFTRSSIEEMGEAVKSVGKLVDIAQKEADVEMLHCVRNKHASIRALLEVSNRAQGAMNEAIGNGEVARSDHEFRKVAVAVSKVRQFVAEAEACVGAAGATAGATEVEVTSQGITDADETQPIVVIDPVIGIDPPATSPFE